MYIHVKYDRARGMDDDDDDDKHRFCVLQMTFFSVLSRTLHKVIIHVTESGQ
jgi:hypothetical protein